MACRVVPMPGGGNAIVCGPTRRCKCGAPIKFECDWKVPGRKSGTCDAAICAKCTTKPAPGKDLCRKHAAEWEEWKARRG